MKPAQIPDLSSGIEKELLSLESLLNEHLSKGNPHITKEALRLLKSGGKRLRPLFTIAFSMFNPSSDSKQVLHAAAAIETMHMATLIHDDTIDNAVKRRGIDTTFAKHGIHTAVYTGDWMFVKSLQLLSSIRDQTVIQSELLQMLARSIESVCDGELDQYYGRGSIPRITTYYTRIKGKTAAMFVASCVAGAKIAGLSDSQIRIAQEFGESFGIAFQILDDLLDVESTLEVTGKTVKNDLNEGIITLPILIACKLSREYRGLVHLFLKSPSRAGLSAIREEAILTKGISGAKKECRKYISRCMSDLDQLPQGTAVDELRVIVRRVFSSVLEQS